MLSFLHILLVALFGVIYITVLINNSAPNSSLGLWLEVAWGAILIPIGAYITTKPGGAIKTRVRGLKRIYNKTNVSLFNKLAKDSTQPNIVNFYRAIGALLFVVGIVVLWRDVPELLKMNLD